MKALGITCGIGSMLIGAKKAGFKIEGNIEWRKYYHHRDKEGRNTFEENFKKSFLVKNINELEVFPKDIDLVMGHPECGAYSVFNQNRVKSQTTKSDIPLFLDMVGRIKPRFFVMDNLERSLLGVGMEEWAVGLPEYNLFPEWISNYHYGNIQKNRKRLFMIGALKKEKFIFQPGETENISNVSEHLKDCKGVPNHNKHTLKGRCTTQHINFTDKKIGEYVGIEHRNDQMTWKDFRDYFKNQKEGHVMRYINDRGIVGSRMGTSKCYSKKHAHVLTGVCIGVHPTKNVPFTLRERARIQGCPDDFVFYGENLPWDVSKNQAMTKQTGKFMPVQFCEYVTKQIAAHIKGKKFKCSGKRMVKESPFVNEAKQWYCNNVGYRGNKGKVCNNCWLPCG